MKKSLLAENGDHTIKIGCYHLNLNENFIQFESQSAETNDGEYENPQLFLNYAWNGEKFVNESKILDREDDNNIVAEFKYIDGEFVRQ